MARVKRGVAAKKRHKKVLEQAKGYYGNKSRSFRAANEQVMHSGQYAFRDRRAKKGEFRRLWIQRINAACRLNDMSYSRFIAGLERGRHRGRPQDPRRSGRHRRRRLRVARGVGQGSALNDPLAFNNAKVQRLRRLLGRRSSRSDDGAFVVEGRQLVGEAADAGWEIEAEFVAAGTSPVTGVRRVRARDRCHRTCRVDRLAPTDPRRRTHPADCARPGDGRLRPRRRPHRRPRQPRDDPAVGRGGRGRWGGAHRRLGRSVQSQGRAGVGRGAVPCSGARRRPHVGTRRPACARSARRRIEEPRTPTPI